MRFDESLSCVLKGYLLGRLRPLHGPLAVTGSNGVNTSRLEPPRFQRPRTGFGEAYSAEGAKPHVPGAALKRIAEDPCPRPGGGYLEVESAAIGIHACRLRPGYRQRRQSPDLSRHAPLLPMFLPTSLSWIMGDAQTRFKMLWDRKPYIAGNF